MLRRMKLARKITLGFGAVAVIFAVATTANWFSLHGIRKRVVLNGKVGQRSEQLLEIRRQEKNFFLRGFEKYGSDTKNAVEKWLDMRDGLAALLGRLQQSRDLGSRDRDAIARAKGTFDEYSSAFTSLTEGRKKQDAALTSWQQMDTEILAKATDTQKGLSEGIIREFLSLRIRLDELAAANTDARWGAYQAQLARTRAAAAWRQRVQDDANLTTAADAFAKSLDVREADSPSPAPAFG
jgi:hypothetical protein